MIYKYYAPNDNNFCALMNEYFWCSKRKYLNDPMDTYGEIINNYPVLLKELEKRNLNTKEYSKVLDLFGICCFTKSGLNDYFWEDYSDSYKGWALEFDDFNLRDKLSDKVAGIIYDEVVYSNCWPDLNNLKTKLPDNTDYSTSIETLLKDEKQTEKLFNFLIMMKEKDRWGIEDEIRIVLAKNHSFYIEELKKKETELKVNGYRLNWPKDILKSITVGHNMNPKHIEIMKQIAKCKNVPLYKTKTVDSGLGFDLTTETIELILT